MERSVFGLVLAKSETTYGVDPVPTGGLNTIAMIRNTVKFGPKFTHIMRQVADGSFSKVAGANTLPEVSFDFSVEVRGNRTTGAVADISAGYVANKLEIDCLLQACDLTPTYTAESSGGARDGNVTYLPLVPATTGASVTFYFYSGLKLHKITGCKGTVKGSLQAGQFGQLDFSFTGSYVDVVDAALPAAGNYLATVAVQASGTGYVVGDILTIAGGTGTVTASARVTAVSSTGQITGIKVAQVGLYSVSPSLSANAVTGGTGTTATLNLTFNANTAAVFLNTKPPVFSASGSTVGSYSPVFTKLDFDLGAKVTKREDANSVNGVAGFLITDRATKATIDPESVVEATSPVWDDLNSATSRTITGKIGTDSGNKFQVQIIGVPESVSYGDRQGLRTTPITYSAERANLTDAVNSEFALKFY